MQQQRQHMIRASDMYRKYVPGVYQRQQYLPRAVSSPIVCGLNICDQYPRYTHVSVVVIVRLPRSRRCVGGAVESLKRSRQSCTAHNACVRFVIGLRTSTHVWVQQQYHITAVHTSTAVPIVAILRGQCVERVQLSTAVRLILTLRHNAANVCVALSILGTTSDPHPSPQCC